jgi:hypothetical protein
MFLIENISFVLIRWWSYPIWRCCEQDNALFDIIIVISYAVLFYTVPTSSVLVPKAIGPPGYGAVITCTDPDPYLPYRNYQQCCGSGSGMNIPDHISESLETIFWAKNTKIFWCGSRIRNLLYLRSGIRDRKIRYPENNTDYQILFSLKPDDVNVRTHDVPVPTV